MASFSDTTPTVTIQPLSKGLASYYETLRAMAAFVRRSSQNYELKRWVNRFFATKGIKGHDFENEIAALFFSLGTASDMRVIRLTLNWCRMQSARLRRAPAIATTKLHCFVHCLPLRDLKHDLFAAAIRPKFSIMFIAKFFAIGSGHGSRSIQQMSKPRLAGFSFFPGALSGVSGHD